MNKDCQPQDGGKACEQEDAPVVGCKIITSITVPPGCAVIVDGQRVYVVKVE